jgi:hypothetical protein
LKGTYSLDKALNADAWLSAAEMVKECKQINRKSELWEDRSSCNEPRIHERDVVVLIVTLPHTCKMRATNWKYDQRWDSILFRTHKPSSPSTGIDQVWSDSTSGRCA